MNKKAVLATVLAVGLAVFAYFIMRFFPPVEMPHRLFYDSIGVRTANGKKHTDTIWQKVPDFHLTNQLGQTISWKELEGKVVVADFFFTTCPTICPLMTANMKRLQNSIHSNNKVGSKDANFIHFISFTVDPERDNVQRLKQYADRYQINPQNWWLLTGKKKEIYDLAYYGMRMGITETNIDTAFIHPQQFVLIDKERVIRARKDQHGNPVLYNGLDSADVKNLAEDIILLSLEKDKNKKSPLAGRLELIAIVFAVAIIGLIILFTVMKKERKKQ